MQITVLCTDQSHPVFSYLLDWRERMIELNHDVIIATDKSELNNGDILFLVSCSQVISKAQTSKFKAALVLHASDLPNGRGWSPHVWSILHGANEITLCLLEADNSIDTGAIWLKNRIKIESHMLLSEINNELFNAELLLMTQAVDNFEQMKPIPQNGVASYWPKRSPEDSRLDPDKSISDQFDILRLADSDRHPAFIDYLGNRYLIKIEKVTD